MNINRAKQMFGNMAKASVSHGREELQEGRYAVLVQKVENKETRKFVPYTAFRGVVLWPVCDGVGRLPDAELYEGSPKGSMADWASFYSDYYASNIKTFIATCLGLTMEDLKAQEKNMSEAEINDQFFQYCLAMTGEEVRGEETVKTGPGVFDGSVVIEVRVTKSTPVPKKGDDEDDDKVKKAFTNVHPNRRIPLSEVATRLTEEEIAIYFGSLENFATLMEAEEA